MNFTTPRASSNDTTPYIWQLSNVDICVLSIDFLFGLPTHSYIIWLIVTGTRHGVASEFITLNLSVSEIGTCLNCLLFVVSSWFLEMIPFALFLLGFSIAGRPLFQCLISVERYLAVVQPVTFLKYKPLRYRVICCSLAWILIFGSCLACMITLMSNYVNAHAWFFITMFLLFLSIQLFSLVAVLRALKQSGPGERKKEEENHMKRRAFLLILINTVNLVITYLPLTISGLFIILENYYNLGFWVGAACYILAGFVQPVLYLHRTGKLSCHCFT